MQDLIFYDFDFNRLNDYRKFISSNWTINYCGYGSFEAHFPKTQTDLIEMLDKNTYLLCIQGDNQAVITGWQIDEDIAVFGKTPEWLMTRRALNAFSFTATYSNLIANSIVNSGMNDFVTVLPSGLLGTVSAYSTSEVRFVYDIICEVLDKDKLGFSLRADIANKRFVFRPYNGTARKTVVSESNKSAHNMLYTKELQDYTTASGWYQRKMENMGSWDAANNSPALVQLSAVNAYHYYKITSDGTQFGLECKKGDYLYSDVATGTWKTAASVPASVWVYINNTTARGAKRWDFVLNGMKTYAEAQAELRTKKISETIGAELRRLEYGTDYQLGDTVRVQFEAGNFKKTLTKRVSGVQIFYDVDRQGICPILSD